MRHILTSVFLIVLLFPALAMGATVKFDGLVQREGLYHKKFSDVLFTEKTTRSKQGSFRNGKIDGPWINYWYNGQLLEKGTYKDGVKISD